MSDDPRAALTWRERALISEALAQELINDLAALRADTARYKAALVIARHWMHMDADPGEFESFTFEVAQVDAALRDTAASAPARGVPAIIAEQFGKPFRGDGNE